MEIVQIISSSLVVLGLFKLFPDFFFAKSLENHKAKLKTESDNLNTQLRIQAFQHEKSFTILQEKRAEVIEETYDTLVKFVAAIEDFVNPMEWAGEESKDIKLDKANKAISKFREYFSGKKIYLEKSFCKKIDKVFKEAMNAGHIYSTYKQIEPGSDEMHKEKRNACIGAYKKMKDEVVPLLEDLEDEFRKLIGVS
jgi:hypothetical protein